MAGKFGSVIAATLTAIIGVGAANAAETSRVSVSSDGQQGDNDSSAGVVSGNGRFVAFTSSATTLAPPDGSFAFERVYLRDLVTNTTTIVDTGPNGTSAGASSPAISADGRYVAFQGSWEELTQELSFAAGIFLRDMELGTVTFLSVDNAGEPGDNSDTAFQPAVSADGRFVVFTTLSALVDDDTDFFNDIYLRDTLNGTTERVSEGISDFIPSGDGDDTGGASDTPSISDDGRFVVFDTLISIDNDPNVEEGHIFLRDRTLGTTTSIIQDGRRGSPQISADGRFVVFHSGLDSLVAGDTNFSDDVFLYEIATSTFTRISEGGTGGESRNPAISGDGRFIVYEGLTDQFQDAIYLYDRNTNQNTLVLGEGLDQANASPNVSDNGEIIAFDSRDALVANDTNGDIDVFVYDRQTLPPNEALLVASVLPTSRSVQVGDTASAFATIINAGSGVGLDCAPGLPMGMGIPFSFQPTDAATNMPIGTADAPVEIAAGAAQSFVFSLSPTVALAPTSIAMEFACSNSDLATTIEGVNTFLFSASDQPVADVIVLAATLGEIPGVVDLDGVSGSGAFAIATFNVGASDTFTVAPRASAGLAVTLSICETNPLDGTCLQPPTAEVATSIAGGATPTFAVFATGTGVDIPLDAATRRIAVEFKDSGNAIRGGSSVAVRTN